jgi:type IV secretion system protein VirB2
MFRVTRILVLAQLSFIGFIGLQSAAYANQLAPVQSTLQRLVQTLTGPISTSLAILAVIAAGFMAWAGRLTWFFAGSIIFGIVLVFGSAQIVNFFQTVASSGGG